MLISPKHERQIDWSILGINQRTDSEWAMIVSGDRQKVTLVDRNLSPKYEYQLPDAISRSAISPKGDLLAAIMANGNHLAIVTAENQIVFEEQLPNPPVKFSYVYNDNGFQDCWFDADGLRFWCMKLSGDLHYFYRFDSDSILSVHSQVLSQQPDSKQKTLVIFGGKELFGSLAKVQQSAPYSKLFIQSLGIS